MGLLDNVKAKLGPAKGKVSDLAQRHEDKIQHGLDKAAQVVDKRTKGKYSDRIRSGTGKAKGAMDRLAHQGDSGPDAGGTPPPPGAGGTTPPGAGGTTPPDTGRAAPPRDAGGTPPPDAPPPTS
ncbi:antitoxin [Streptomyces coeruleorubidus]|uniref:antitoxin n=1 Tax=Streptomyces coeruleorubidus TaxID=116188 RepID=UPI00237EF4A4|nr:antitoxin [Streptomyces coeruleorubidus]WDV54979.1 antitoxin [Streptomyces coeruleorubidus]